MSTPQGFFPDLPALDAATNVPNPDLATAGDSTTHSTTETPSVGWLFEEIGPPSALYVTINDVLQVVVTNSYPQSTSFDVRVKMLMPDGTTNVSVYSMPITNSVRTGDVGQFNLPEGFILGIAGIGQGPGLGPQRGQYYVQMGLIRGAPQSEIIYQQLFAGYLSFAYLPCWPEGDNGDMYSGPGTLYGTTGPAPAAGANAIITVPARVRWKVNHIAITLTTSAAVANRIMALQVLRLSGANYAVQAIPSQPASQTNTYNFEGLGARDTTLQFTTFNPIPPGLELRGGDSINTSVVALQAGDQLTGLTLFVEELIDIAT